MTIQHSPDKVKEVRDAYVQETFASIAAMSDHFGISRAQIMSWRDSEGWDDQRATLQHAVDRALMRKMVDQRMKTNEEHFQLWAILRRHCQNRLLEVENGDMVLRKRITTGALLKISMILERIQRGQRISLGLDVPSQAEVTATSITINYQGLRAGIRARRAEEEELEPPEAPKLEPPGNGTNGKNGAHEPA